MNTSNPVVKEVTFDKSKVAKLRKRIFLPADLQAETHEQRFVHHTNATVRRVIQSYLDNYNRNAGFSTCWLAHRRICEGADSIEIIIRVHKLGKFLLFHPYYPKQDD